MRPARGGRGAGPSAPPNPQDWLPPSDPNVASLFVTGVEDDLPEHELRVHFAQYGQLRSLVCSHRAHCAYVNYVNRKDAETAAETLKGKVVIKGCPMRVTWGSQSSWTVWTRTSGCSTRGKADRQLVQHDEGPHRPRSRLLRRTTWTAWLLRLHRLATKKPATPVWQETSVHLYNIESALGYGSAWVSHFELDRNSR